MPASTSIGQRFTQLIQQLGMSKNAFAQSLDKTATVIQHLVDERNKPGYDLMCKVFEVYPNVSKDWLLLGDGPMLLTTTATAAEPPAATTTAPMAAITAAPVLTTPELLPAPSAVETVPPLATSAAPTSSEPAAPVSVSEASPVTPTAAPVEAAPAPTPLPSPQPMPAIPAAPDVSYLTAALQTQYLQHQLALAEQRNQHLLEQQKLMQQMLNLLQRNTA
jgi:plasmid maintenance system antidote protein VapI